MSVTQALLVVKNPKESLSYELPEQYDKPRFASTFTQMFSQLENLYTLRREAEQRVKEARERNDHDYQEPVMFLVLIHCHDGEDLEIIEDLRFKDPDIPIIIASAENRYGQLAALKDCGSMAIDADAGAFIRAEYQAYWLLMEKKKKTQAMKKTG